MAKAQASGPGLSYRFSVSAFVRGLAVAGAIYAGLATWLFLSHDHVQDLLLKRLASQTVIVDWQESRKTHSPVAAEATPHVPAPGPSPHASETPQAAGSLSPAPIDGLYENTPLGPMPKISREGDASYFSSYRRPFDPYASEAPIIALAVSGLGLSDVATDSALRNMPPDVSFILSPYALALDLWVNESRSRGHEVWFTLPMETASYPQDDPGPHTMLIGAPERENLSKLDWLMTRAHGYTGFVTNYDPSFMSSQNDLRPVIGSVYNHGLGFIDGSARPGMIPQTMALGMKAPYSTVDLWIDHSDKSPQAISAALADLETIARDKGYAVGIVQALPVSYQQVLEWVNTLPGKGIRLAPLSATTGR